MSRKSTADQSRTRRLADPEVEQAFWDGADELAELARSYDRGNYGMAPLMSVVIHRMFVENSFGTRFRGNRRFSSPSKEAPSGLVTAFHRLIFIASDDNQHPPTITFKPVFHVSKLGVTFKPLSFKDWWNQTIYRAPATSRDLPLGYLVTEKSQHVPVDKRETVSRQQLVRQVRNKVGAHSDLDQLLILDDLRSEYSFGMGLAVRDRQGVTRSSETGDLTIVNSPLPAMMRQIACEVLTGLGRDDPWRFS